MIKSRELIADNSSTICSFHFKLWVLSMKTVTVTQWLNQYLKNQGKTKQIRRRKAEDTSKIHSSFQYRALGSTGQILRSSQSCCQEGKLIISFSQRRHMFEKSHRKDKKNKLVEVFSFKSTNRYYLSVSARQVTTLSFSFHPKIFQLDWLHSCPSWSFKDRSLLIKTGGQKCGWMAITEPIPHFN